MPRADQATIDLLTDYFHAMEAKDFDRLGAYYADDITLTFANAQPSPATTAVLAQMTTLLGKVKSLAHPLINVWQEDDGVVIFEVTSIWRLHDDTEIKINACSIFTIVDGKFTDQRIYVDNAPVDPYLDLSRRGERIERANMRTSGRTQTIAVSTSALLWGLQLAFLVPTLALLLTDLFGSSVGQVSLVIVVYNTACLLAVYFGSRIADRRGNYRGLMLAGGVLTVALSLALANARSFAVGVAALVLLGAPAVVGTPLLFGYIRHAGAARSEVVRTRALFSAAWFVGPPLAAVIIARPGAHTLVLAIGLVGALQVVATAALRSHPAAVRSHDAEAELGEATPLRNPTVVLILLVVIFAGLQATNTAGISIITLFSTETLHLSPVWGGVALGVAAAIEVPALLGLARLYRKKQDDFRILTIASVIGIGYYLGVAAVPSGALLILLQIPNALFYAVVAGVGLTIFQALIAGPGRASGMLANSQLVGAILAGPLVALGSLGSLGLRAVWIGCAIVTLGLLGLMHVTRRLIAASAN